MKTSVAGLAFIKHWEGTRLVAYRDSGGVWTIGVGHTGPDVVAGRRITDAEATALLAADVAEAEAAVARVSVPLSQNQYDALVSFAFNVGNGAFLSSTLLRKLNAGDYDAVPGQLDRWVNDNGRRVQGLVNRRKAEGELWSTALTSVVNDDEPEQTSTIPTAPPPDRVPPARPAADPWWVRLLSLLLSIIGRKRP